MKIKLFVAILIIIFSGCSKFEDFTINKNQKKISNPVVIKYGLWGSQQEVETQREIVNEFNKNYPDIKIELSVYPDSETFWERFPYENACKSAPDIIKLTNEGYLEYARRGMIIPIEKEISKSGIDINIYDDKAVSIWTADNRLYGVPLSITPSMFFINKDMWQSAKLKEYPRTWEDVKLAAKKLSKNSCFGLCINNHSFHITNYVLSFGGGWGYGKTINSDSNQKAIQFIIDMLNEKLAVTPNDLEFGWDGEAFANQKVAMTTGGYWYIGFLKKVAPSLNYDIIPIPAEGIKTFAIHSDGIAVLKNASNITHALKALKYLTCEYSQIKLMKAIGFKPSIKSISEKYYENNPKVKSIKQTEIYSQEFAYPLNSIEFNQALIKNIEEKIYKQNSRNVKTILKELNDKFGSK